MEAVREWLFSLPLPAGRQAQIIILEILYCIPACPVGLADRTGVVIIFAFLDLGKNISFSESLLVIAPLSLDTEPLFFLS